MSMDTHMNIRFTTIGLAAALALFCSWSTHARAQRAQEFRIGAGVDYSSGKYGEADETKILSIPFSIRYARFPWTLRASIPWIQIEGPDDIVIGADGALPGGTSSGIEKNNGLGDFTAAVMYSIDPQSEAMPALDLTAKLKAPTADEGKRLGTGKADYSFQIDASKTWGDWTPFLTAGYQFMGSSDELPLDDRAYGSVGCMLRLMKSATVGLAYDYRQAASDRSEDSHEIGVFGTIRARTDLRISPYVAIGLSDGAPDWNVGVQTQLTL